MVCRQCGTQIAEKALICFKCGIATTERRLAPPAGVPRRSRLPLVGAAVLLAAVLLGAWQAGLLSW